MRLKLARTTQFTEKYSLMFHDENVTWFRRSKRMVSSRAWVVRMVLYEL